MTPPIKLEQTKRVSSLGTWVRLKDGSYQCGNVKVMNVGGKGREASWRIFVRSGRKWEVLVLKSRPWGYGSAGQAKVGAALVAAHQRGVYR